MKINKYLNKYDIKINLRNNHKVSKICDNSKDVIYDAVFVAIKGTHNNGIDFIEEAILKGAKTIIYNRNENIEIDKNKYFDINFIECNNPQIELSRLLKLFYKVNKKTKIIGITGTNGKTTVSYGIYNILKKLNYNVLLIGTEGNVYFYNNIETIKETLNTTPSIIEIYHLINKHIFDFVIMEVSSQGLEELRVLGLKFDRIVFTNITQDHLDYHKTIDNYAHAKLNFINYLNEDGILILNKDMEYYETALKRTLNKILTYSAISRNCDLFGEVTDYLVDKMVVDIVYQNTEYEIYSSLLGNFNLYNLLSIYLTLKSLNITDNDMLDSFEKLKPVNGRMNLYYLENAYVVVDFAHTPDGVKQVLEYACAVKKNRIITVLGAGGNKDKIKRPIMGSIACDYSDVVIFTEDNSRNEDVNNIIDDLISKTNKENYYIEVDRQKAIDFAIRIKEENDIILILGKGTEKYIIRDEKIEFSDIEYIQKLGGIRLNG